MIDPDVPPPLPPQIVPQTVTKADGTKIQVVTVIDAARLCDVMPRNIHEWISEGKVAICYTPTREKRVLLESLWLALPIDVRR